MDLSRRELLKVAGAMVGALPLAELMELPIGRRGREAWAATLPNVHRGDVPDMVLLNARVNTMDASGRMVEAIAIKHGRIMALGRTPETASRLHGATRAMLSSVLRSPRAIAANIAIMRAFVRLREMVAANAELATKLDERQLPGSRCTSGKKRSFQLPAFAFNRPVVFMKSYRAIIWRGAGSKSIWGSFSIPMMNSSGALSRDSFR